jgi:hypothetical protein
MPGQPDTSPRAGAAGALRCGVCGTESRQPAFRPGPPEQAPDLDLRPGEPLRSTMARWLQHCPSCGYTAPDISRAHPAAAQAVQAAPFRALMAEATHPPLARRFLAWAHVLEETGGRMRPPKRRCRPPGSPMMRTAPTSRGPGGSRRSRCGAPARRWMPSSRCG